MTAHAGIALVGASAVFLTIIECLQKHCRIRQVVSAAVAFCCLLALALIPCNAGPVHHVHKHETPTMETRSDIDHVEKLLLANYRRVRQEREIVNARP
jgi:hypothetical protein